MNPRPWRAEPTRSSPAKSRYGERSGASSLDAARERRIGLALALLLGSGCAHPLAALTQRSRVPTQAGEFEVAWAPDAATEEQRLARAVERATPGLHRWGKLEQRVTIYLVQSHEDLTAAVRRPYGWLRAWAQYDELYVQSPASWEAREADFDELMLHELTHCLMYQRAATKQAWVDKQFPLWFREGMASWTANQGARFSSLEDLARFYEQNPDADPVASPDRLYEKSNSVVYGAAHQAFTFLVKRYGEEDVNRILDAMRAGENFPAAFLRVIGISAAAFDTDFRRYVVWRGFRGGRPPLGPRALLH